MLSKCVTWSGCCTQDGYGQQRIEGKNYSVHRLEWTKHFGDIAPGLCVCHHCDNPKCYNIDHLFLGTQKDNVNDRQLKNRTVKGEKHGKSKLNSQDISEIRLLLKIGYPQYVVAEMYNTPTSNISCINSRKTWAHIPEPEINYEP